MLVAVRGGGAIRVPWAIAFGGADVDLIGERDALGEVVRPSDTKPALLALDAGRVLAVDGRPEIRPVRQLDVVLRRADGTQRRAARAAPRRAPRPLSPSASPAAARTGSSCRPGDYVARGSLAYPVEPGPPTAAPASLVHRCR